MANNHFTLNESFCFYLTFFLLALSNSVHLKILIDFIQYILRYLVKFQLNLMVELKITPKNVKLVKLRFFFKFLNFYKNSEILTLAKAPY
jgi:hypothetical protein